MAAQLKRAATASSRMRAHISTAPRLSSSFAADTASAKMATPNARSYAFFAWNFSSESAPRAQGKQHARRLC